MDIDRFIARNAASWHRLDQLTTRFGGRAGRPSAAEVDELVQLYQRVSSHLSHARVAFRDPALVGRLTRLVARANGVVYRRRTRGVRALVQLLAWRFPAAVWQSGRFVLASAALLLLPALAMGTWLSTSDAALDAAAPEEVRAAYVADDFEGYYSSQPASAFASQVTVNNIQVAVLAFAGGVLLCLPTGFMLVHNGLTIGGAGGLFGAAGELGKFFGLILPHGLLELTAVVVAGAAGLRLGWAVIAPGDRPRGEALGAEARRAGVIAAGLVVAFGAAGFIEGFITGRGVPTAPRVAVGVAAEALFVTWVVVQGRSATGLGVTGEIGELDRGWDELARARERAWAT